MHARREATADRRAPGTEMTPELHAVSDRFIYEHATLKHILAIAPSEALGRPVDGHEWTVGQMLAHLADSLGEYERLIRRWLEGEAPLEGWDPDAMNAATASRYADAGVPEIAELFATGINGLVAALASIPDQQLAEPLGRADALTTLRFLGEHCLNHAIPIVDAVPEIRMDPLVLNWLLGADFEGDAANEWQNRLLRDAREYIASLPDEDDEEDE
ncbi:MAG: DinB family protein [bacterium]